MVLLTHTVIWLTNYSVLCQFMSCTYAGKHTDLLRPSPCLFLVLSGSLSIGIYTAAVVTAWVRVLGL